MIQDSIRHDPGVFRVEHDTYSQDDPSFQFTPEQTANDSWAYW